MPVSSAVSPSRVMAVWPKGRPPRNRVTSLLFERLGKPENCRTIDPPLRQVGGTDQNAACHYAEDCIKSDVGVAHIEDRPMRHGTPDAALRVAHKSTAEIIGEIPEGDIDHALIPSIEEVPPGGEGSADTTGGADGGSKPN